LPDFGVEPVVYIPENPTYPIIDENLNEDFSNLSVLKHKIKEPYSFASVFSKNKTQKISSGIIPKKKKQSFLERMLLYIAGKFFTTDASVLWVRPSLNYLERYIQENGIETIITTRPPHS